MRKVIEYRTVMADNTPQAFDDFINKCIQGGYEPYGNPYSIFNGGKGFLCQAMVRYEEEK